MVQHIGENRFEVVELPEGMRSPTIEVPSPYEQEIKNRPNDNLMSRLGWYLEEFLQYPFEPWTDQAKFVEEALETWGREAFKALFESGNPRDWMTRAKADASSKPVRLRISSDDPTVLSWPWEALRDPAAGVVGHQFQMERKLNLQMGQLPEISASLPRDCINILLVTARPYKGDVAFRSISRRVVDLVANKNLPVTIEVLRV